MSRFHREDKEFEYVQFFRPPPAGQNWDVLEAFVPPERSGPRRPALLAVASAVLPVALVGGALLWPPSSTISGTPQAIPAAVVVAPPSVRPTPSATSATTTPPPITAPPVSSVAVAPPPAAPPPPPPAQPPGTVRLPSGSTATLVRQDVVNGVLPVPKDLNQAAWWGADLAADRGATVFAGHVNYAGHTGPFAELWTSHVDQLITVVAPDGQRTQYRITQLLSLSKDELPQRAPDLFGQTGPHRLVLVTCGGEWVGGEQGYADNRVAIAEPA